ncbi:hypothetical protein RCH11_000238 [Glaciihabitans sp. GrIS 2.15]|nr:hypothetical protein [Glaciihabitans sp. GrIS 2.15]
MYPVHRKKPAGELFGAVVAGIRKGTEDGVIVMDRDLQHPPEMMPVLVTAGKSTGADVVIASRHAQGGSSAGLDGSAGAIASLGAEVLAWATFPLKLGSWSDPMTGFFAVRRASFLPALRFGRLSGFPVIGGLLSPADPGRPAAQL